MLETSPHHRSGNHRFFLFVRAFNMLETKVIPTRSACVEGLCSVPLPHLSVMLWSSRVPVALQQEELVFQ